MKRTSIKPHVAQAWQARPEGRATSVPDRFYSSQQYGTAWPGPPLSIRYRIKRTERYTHLFSRLFTFLNITLHKITVTRSFNQVDGKNLPTINTLKPLSYIHYASSKGIEISIAQPCWVGVCAYVNLEVRTIFLFESPHQLLRVYIHNVYILSLSCTRISSP